jgi:hypothetical protein
MAEKVNITFQPAKKKLGQFLQGSRNWQKCSALLYNENCRFYPNPMSKTAKIPVGADQLVMRVV